uniref:TAFH domain-containing protein n=1 Tax=Nothobranchius furzeri TaxID=105023 RepID=A0A8C6LTH7_NOTFU
MGDLGASNAVSCYHGMIQSQVQAEQPFGIQSSSGNPVYTCTDRRFSDLIHPVSSLCSSAVLNGSSHSPTSLNGAPSTPNGFSNGPAMSSTASLSNQQLPPACGARQLCKLKRFLTTLQQFGNDISPEIGERVRSLVLGLVNSTLTIEEFHTKLHEATNFPLRPFVIPFLKIKTWLQRFC